MKTRPILFNGAMVRAILDGRKTQTRRIVKLPAFHEWGDGFDGQIMYSKDEKFGGFSVDELSCPIGRISDHLWVRETWQAWHKTSYECDEWEAISVVQASASKSPEFKFGPTCDAIEYKATSKSGGPWTPSIHMPRWASRIQLEITGVRVERLNDISEDDAEAEGIEGISTPTGGDDYQDYWRNYGLTEKQADGWPWFTGDRIASYRSLWESINGAGSWDANPWVWVIEFRRVAA